MPQARRPLSNFLRFLSLAHIKAGAACLTNLNFGCRDFGDFVGQSLQSFLQIVGGGPYPLCRATNPFDGNACVALRLPVKIHLPQEQLSGVGRELQSVAGISGRPLRADQHIEVPLRIQMEHREIVAGGNRKAESWSRRKSSEETYAQEEQGTDLTANPIGSGCIDRCAAISGIGIWLTDIEVEVTCRQKDRMIDIVSQCCERLRSDSFKQHTAGILPHLGIVAQPFGKP